ncbi:MAG: hypothetical protein Q7J07_01140 [Pelolinea sp.]|nr:hypothetical protein [Pelolinea sp.]
MVADVHPSGVQAIPWCVMFLFNGEILPIKNFDIEGQESFPDLMAT